MPYPTFDETCLAAISYNRAREFWDHPHVISKYRDGRHGPDWHTTRWRDEADELHRLSMGWHLLGIEPQQRIAVMSGNRPRWIQAAMSIGANNAVLVPIYPTLTATEAAFILRDSGARHVVVDTLEQARKVLSRSKELPDLDRIVVMDALDGAPPRGVVSWDEQVGLADGKLDMELLFAKVREIAPGDLVSIIYTSGTTGRPKGVMLTNDNYKAQRVVQPHYGMTSADVFLNHLPFCHAFGLTADLLGSANVGATLAIAEGLAPEQIRHALTTIRPTVLMSVPRLFEKIYIQVHQVVSSRPSALQDFFHRSLAVGKRVFDLRNEGRPVPLGLRLKFKVADKILMKVRTQAGLDNVRIAYAGGGPTSKELCYFFQSLGIDLYQGYGLTETGPIANVNIPGRNKMGTVGPPVEGCEEKLADDGEILIRGNNLMRGYFNDPEATARAIDADGWLHTGDIGTIDADGYLTITDRKKELIVTSGAKNIAPLKIESAFNTEPFIERVVVIGDGQRYLTALICPNFTLLREWARQRGLRRGADAELITRPEVLEMVQNRVDHVNRSLARFEQIKRFALMDHEFSEATGELTPTQKVKRRVIAELYSDLIDGLYEG